MGFAHLTGFTAAPFTPMHEDGSIDFDRIGPYAKFLAHNGVRGAFVCGTTGEGASLTTEERIELAGRWKDAAPEDLDILVHVGHTSLRECRRFAAHAQEIGARAIGMIGPYFYLPACLDDLVDFCRDVAAAAPQTPFYYYHMPAMTGVDYEMEAFLTAAADRIPTLAGVKFTYENLLDYSRCLTLMDGRFDMRFGRDEIILSALACGARSFIGSTYNHMAPIYHRILKAFQAGDMEAAANDQRRVQQVVKVYVSRNALPANKVLMKLTGMDCGPVRLPLRTVPPDEQDVMRAELEQIGYYDFCSKVPS